MQLNGVVGTGLSRQICHGFWVSVGIGWGIGGWYREYVKTVLSRSTQNTHMSFFPLLFFLQLIVCSCVHTPGCQCFHCILPHQVNSCLLILCGFAFACTAVAVVSKTTPTLFLFRKNSLQQRTSANVCGADWSIGTERVIFKKRHAPEQDRHWLPVRTDSFPAARVSQAQVCFFRKQMAQTGATSCSFLSGFCKPWGTFSNAPRSSDTRASVKSGGLSGCQCCEAVSRQVSWECCHIHRAAASQA